jgi:MFS superfamily sulfate permease-like transporter
VVFGIVFVIRTNHHSAFTLVQQHNMYLLRFNKDASFVNKTELKTKLASLPPQSEVIVDGTKATFIDSDIYDVLADFESRARHDAINVEFKQFHNKSQNYRKRRRLSGIV